MDALTPEEQEQAIQQLMERYTLNHDDAQLLLNTIHKVSKRYKTQKDNIEGIIMAAYENGKCIAEGFGLPYSLTEFMGYFMAELKDRNRG